MKNRSGEKIKLASIDELLGVVNEESAMERSGKDHGQCMHHHHICRDRGCGSCDCCSDDTDWKDHYQFHY